MLVHLVLGWRGLDLDDGTPQYFRATRARHMDVVPAQGTLVRVSGERWHVHVVEYNLESEHHTVTCGWMPHGRQDIQATHPELSRETWRIASSNEPHWSH